MIIYRFFLLNFLLAVLSFLPLLLKGKGIFLLCNDFNAQQIPFHMLANDALKSGNVFWNRSIDLGSNFVGSLGFYVLGSPFAWLSFLFPASWYPYVTGWLYMGKYAMAAMTAYGYIKRFTEKKYAAISATLYAFSGFQAVNLIFHHFHDAVAFFPLLLIGYEKLIREGKKGMLAAGVCINALVNYYFFIQEVIFLVLYFLCREGIRLWKNRRLVGHCFAEGILGTGMAGILFVPDIWFTLHNPRISRLLPAENWFYKGNRDYLQVFHTLLFPGELMNARSCIKEYDWSSWSSYLPMLSLSLVICYIVKKKKDWLSKILLISIGMTAVPVLNSVFGLFSDSNYHRWLFMPVLMMSLASAKVMEERRTFPVKKVCTVLLVLMILFTTGSFWWSEHRFTLINRPEIFLIWSVTGIMGVLLTLLFSMGKEKRYLIKMGGGITIFAIWTTGLAAWLYGGFSDWQPQAYYNRIMAFRNLQHPDDRYRIISNDNTLLMTASLPGTGSFTSMVNGSIYEFYDKLGMQRLVFTPEWPDGLCELMGGKYEVLAEPEKEAVVVAQVRGKDKTYYICERELAVPIGSAYDTYMKESVFSGLDTEARITAMLKCIIVPEESEADVADVLTEWTPEQMQDMDLLNKEQLVRERCREASREFHISQSGFETLIETDREKYAFFSIPYDEGFRAWVNGKKVDILKTNGLMAVRLEAGENRIRFAYRDIPLLIGTLCTCFSFLIWVYYTKISHAVSFRLRSGSYSHRNGAG